MLPSVITINQYSVNTFGIFVLIGFLFLSFAVWYEGRKDGFDEEKLFDALLLASVGSVMLSRMVFAIGNKYPLDATLAHTYKFWTPGTNPYGAVVGALLVLYLLAKLWKWSVYRVLDIYALAVSFGAAFLVLGFVALQKRFEFIFVFAAFVLLYAVLSKFRNVVLRSGVSFSVFLIAVSLMGVIFVGTRLYLPLYVMLVTISLGILYFRGRQLMANVNLPAELLEKFKSILKIKDKQLALVEEGLEKTDPYMSSDRTLDNAELGDDTAEDIAKTDSDAKLSSIAKMQIQVKRALAKMKLGTYGMCEICRKPIDNARLEAFPAATTCIEHADSK